MAIDVGALYKTINTTGTGTRGLHRVACFDGLVTGADSAAAGAGV